MGKVGQPDGSMIMPFGKYEGEAIEDIPSSYLRWLVESLDDDKADLIEAAEAELQYRDNYRCHK